MSESGTVLSAFADGVLTLTLNRPDKLNSFNEDMHLALRAGFERAHRDVDVRAVLLSGAGRGFSAGQDLGDRDPRSGTPDLGHTIEIFYNPLLRLIRSLEKPVICAVNGVAAGAGANIAFACDITLAARSARFIQAFAKIGLVPDSGGTWNLPRLIGEARAKALALTAEPLDAETAASWGLIWRAVDDDKLMDEATALATRLAAGPTKGLGLTKRAIQAAATNSLDQQLDFERDLQREAGRSADYAEGVTAFLEKRKPEFKGK
ncbi:MULTISPECIES: 2-(1,2-epoxy-1,2-dihydrophenyl)acetyl-CoA isomerase PaaG [unclassified Rhizobium]|uniref:2-(1,2-epoxy-1,2-dihydrophenyl)acetyl-CoA isomerase PaaG n=1 Tax=unclassified Rhizobium TaxID=2613769 RepID=UPI001616E879|nr:MULTISPECIES: 2-(1,2-epoxy-1,2-dihydrophenyl)acetyl-CoA isomerase PaaG [unclassified Rhizobium]MBB3384069.1 2-(1,2-epoxy-1,2-dihydrophenyl)acetyl-CoA isomerase [Rhizobium sp. BK098]MBB3615769.1 2-(1,2-epoxy-1,2-dihydrophenyl)acetyl-CoA isomerase [Rhizobium sp. BK609]MBB3681428.1 2-(1,2-epoxy-1,2-dihydrophenyl)acetyl-CoA isomerase [Rhizobium sp. BK612]